VDGDTLLVEVVREAQKALAGQEEGITGLAITWNGAAVLVVLDRSGEEVKP
jgi:hypothetical protein